MSEDCPGCGVNVRLAAGEVDRLLAAYLATHAVAQAAQAVWVERLAVCRACPDLLYGTTCRHCGCLVEVRARLAGKACPAPAARW